VTVQEETMKYHFRPHELRTGVRGEGCGLDFLSCQRVELGAQQSSLTVETGPEEVVLVCLEGQVDYEFAGTTGTAKTKDFLYVPWKSAVTVKRDGEAVLMRIGAPSDRDSGFAHIPFTAVDKDPTRHQVFGSAEDNSLRDVYMYIDDGFNASRLLMGIGQGSTGGWTVWPPHEHGDEKEELYVYFDMGRAFGIQCIYETLDRPLFCGIVRDGDMVAVPRGFHPNVGCPGGRISYVYAMAARAAGQRDFMALRFQDEFGDRF
jgi:5-deoxy-glucuronate isomerase